jgi:hypothetical protein
MKPFIIPIVLFLIVFVIAELLKKESTSKFQKVQFLLTHSELTFYKYLKENIPSYITVMCKVRLIDIIKPVSKGKAYISDKNRVKSKHIDFVLIDENSSEIKALIELNGGSHQRSDRMTRDSFVNELTKGVGLHLFFIKIKPQYKIEDIKKVLESI